MVFLVFWDSIPKWCKISRPLVFLFSPIFGVVLARSFFPIFRLWIPKRCKGVHCVDLSESFPTSIYLQKSTSIQPRTSPSKFGGKFNSIFIRLLGGDPGAGHDCGDGRAGYARYTPHAALGREDRREGEGAWAGDSRGVQDDRESAGSARCYV